MIGSFLDIAMKLVWSLAVIVLAVVLFGFILRLMNPLPPLEPRPPSTAIAGTDMTKLGQVAAAGRIEHPGSTGIYPLADGQDALAARVALARAAEKGLDLQYYIWHGDVSGNLLMRELLAAADRGVRVRLLLDDNGTSGLDAELAALDQHAGIEVRLFNPFMIRSPKALGYVMDLRRLNRRMHNKAFIADSQAAVVGGRNIGDEYFGIGDGALFDDLDVIAVGPVVADAAADFDRYWSSQSTYLAEQILPTVSQAELGQLRQQLQESSKSPQFQDYAEAIAQWLRDNQSSSAIPTLEWVPVTMFSDDPAKGLGAAKTGGLLIERLERAIGKPTRSLALVSAYFVPTDAGASWFSDLARSGVDVSILTNALEATDVAAVHAGYAPHRPGLLDAGVKLWELKSKSDERAKLGFGVGSGSGARPALSASSSSLHAKTFAIDGERVFVGSFNFDPRSVALNTEMGFLIESPTLAGAVHQALGPGLAQKAYQVSLQPDGQLAWEDRRPEGIIVHPHDPGTGWFQRALVRVMGWLPIESFL